MQRRTAHGGGVFRRKKAVAHPFFAFRGVFLRVSGVRNERAEICTRTSVQVAIGLFPIDSVRGEFLLLSLLFFAHCLHLPFTCTSRSFFRVTPPLPLSSSHTPLPYPSLSYPSLSRSPFSAVSF